MKIKFLLQLCVASVAALLLATSCSTDSVVDKEYAKYITSKEYKSDLDNFFYAGALQQSLSALMLHACSNEFTCTKNDTVNFGDRKLVYWRDYSIIMATIEEHQDEFKQSYERLEKMGVFENPTPVLDDKGNVVALGPRRAVDCTDPESRAMALLAPPAHAGTVGGILLFAQALYEFCGISSDLAKESRKTVVTVASHLSDNDRKVLFDQLETREKSGETDYKKWWNNFADGKYDVQAHRVYRTIMVANDSPAKTNYMSVADDMGILSEKEFTSKAGRAVTAGAKLYVECVNKVVGAVAPTPTVYYGDMAKAENIKGTILSYGSIYDKLDRVNNTVEAARSIVKGTITEEEADEYTMNTLKAIVSDETSGKYLKLPKGVEMPLDGHLGGGEFVEYAQILLSAVKKAADRKNDPKLTWEDEAQDMAQIQVNDKDGKPTGMIVASDKETGDIYAFKDGSYSGNTSIKVPAGDYTVTAIDKNGDKQTIAGVRVKKGEKKKIDVEKNEQEIIEGLMDQEENEQDVDENENEDEANDDTDGKDPNAGVIPPGEDEEASASDNNTEATNEEFSIVGNWRTINVDKLVLTTDAAKLDEKDWARARSIKLTTRPNNTFTYSTDHETVSGTYTFDGMTLVLKGGGDKMICPVVKMGNNKIKLTFDNGFSIGVVTMVK